MTNDGINRIHNAYALVRIDVGNGFRSVDGLRDDVILSLTMCINSLPNTLHYST